MEISMNIDNRAPRIDHRGIRDNLVHRALGSRVQTFRERIPTHLPHVFAFTQKGPREPQIVNQESAHALYGKESFNLRGPFATHQTLLSKVLHKRDNYYLLHRLPAPGSETATLGLTLQIATAQQNEYVRTSDGGFEYDEDGEKIPTGRVIDTYLLRWKLVHVEEDEFGRRTRKMGTFVIADNGLTGEDDLVTTEDGEIVITDQSQDMPVMDFRVNGFGSFGNNVGIRLWQMPRMDIPMRNADPNAPETPIIYGLHVVERDDVYSSPRIHYTNDGQEEHMVTFSSNFLDNLTGESLRIDDVLNSAYADRNARPVRHGAFDAVHFYEDNVEALLRTLHSAEYDYGAQPDWENRPQEHHRINIIDGVDFNGNEYHTFRVAGMSEEGFEWGRMNTAYAMGGEDGDMSKETFDSLVREQLENYGDLEHPAVEFPFLDMGYYPQSVIYDTGFTMETKKAMMVPVKRRPDIGIVWSTQDLMKPLNTEEEESAISSYLKAYARTFPESRILGTDTCRVMIVGHAGKLVDNAWRDNAPLTIAFADAAAVYMGDGGGRWRTDQGFDQAPYNDITMFRVNTVNLTWKPDEVYRDDWEEGLIHVIFPSRNRLKFAQMQTVYGNEHSPLNHPINVFGAIELQKVGFRVWTELLNNGKMSHENFLELSDVRIASNTQGRFDGRFSVIPVTDYVGADRDTSTRWTTTLTMTGRNGKHINTFTINSEQSRDFYPV